MYKSNRSTLYCLLILVSFVIIVHSGGSFDKISDATIKPIAKFEAAAETQVEKWLGNSLIYAIDFSSIFMIFLFFMESFFTHLIVSCVFIALLYNYGEYIHPPPPSTKKSHKLKEKTTPSAKTKPEDPSNSEEEAAEELSQHPNPSSPEEKEDRNEGTLQKLLISISHWLVYGARLACVFGILSSVLKLLRVFWLYRLVLLIALTIAFGYLSRGVLLLKDPKALLSKTHILLTYTIYLICFIIIMTTKQVKAHTE